MSDIELPGEIRHGGLPQGTVGALFVITDLTNPDDHPRVAFYQASDDPLVNSYIAELMHAAIDDYLNRLAEELGETVSPLRQFLSEQSARLGLPTGESSIEEILALLEPLDE